ncbi:MAG TPA: MarR family transcriptional regulator [Bacilli bacterium]
MINQLIDLFSQNGLRPLSMFPEIADVESKVTRSEFAALAILHLRGEMAMTELASALGAPLSTMTSLTKRLERKGLISRSQSNKDQRMILVKLSAEGAQLAAHGWSILQSAFSRVQSALTPEELNQFVKLAFKIAKAMQAGKTAAGDATSLTGTSPQTRSISIED